MSGGRARSTLGFLKALKLVDYTGALAVEREGGDDRLGDIKTAVNMLKNFKS